MVDVITKFDENSITLKRTVSTEQTNNLEFDYLLKQYKDIQAAKAAAILQYDAQLADVQNLITEAKKLGVKSRVVDIIEEIEEKK